MTEKGQVLDKVADYEFVTGTFALIKLIIPTGEGIFGNALTIDASYIVAVSEDGITVAERMPARLDQRADSLKRVTVRHPKFGSVPVNSR